MGIFYVANTLDMFSEVELGVERVGLERVCEWLETVDEFAVDTETEGMFDHINNVIMLQIGNREHQFVIDTRGRSLDCLGRYFNDPTKLKLFHNAKFDIKFLRHTFGFITENLYDSLLVEACITNGMEDRKLSLEACAMKYCGVTLDKTERNKFVRYGSRPFTYKQIIYGARDIEYLFTIREEQLKIVQQWELENVVWLENNAVLTLADIEYVGMLLDSEAWMKLKDRAQAQVNEKEDELDDMVLGIKALKGFVREYVTQDLFTGQIGRRTKINWSSPTQVDKVFKALGLKDITSTGEKEITKYQNKYPLIKKFIDYKKQQKLVGTYGEEFLKNINPVTGRIHTDIWQILDTHRISTKDPNLQQIPAMTIKDENGKKRYPYLECFVAPEGYKIVNCDFSGQELRLIAAGSNDALWIQIFNEDRDLHGEIAAKIFGVAVEDVKEVEEYLFVGSTKVYMRGKSARDITKTINFMLAYGGSKFKLSDTLGIELEAADVIIKEYFKIVPGVAKFLERLGRYGTSRGYIRSYKPYSIVRHFTGDPRSWDDKTFGSVERRSKNTPIQGSGAMMCKLALVNLRNKTKEVPYHVEIFMQIHDSILCYVEEKHAEEWAIIQKEVMEDAGRQFITSIPVKSDVAISSYWKK